MAVAVRLVTDTSSKNVFALSATKNYAGGSISIARVMMGLLHYTLLLSMEISV